MKMSLRDVRSGEGVRISASLKRRFAAVAQLHTMAVALLFGHVFLVRQR
ncbi:hypothetical protein BV96_01837 [Sphingomonas paucimobilis]|nr:hypothetical protein BV96_01837 [Sphingomonas paucimobilis]